MILRNKIIVLTASHLAVAIITIGAILGLQYGCGSGKPLGPLVHMTAGKIAIESVKEKNRYIYITERCPDGTTDTAVVDKSGIREWRLWHKTHHIILPKYYYAFSGGKSGHGGGIEYYYRFEKIGVGGGGYFINIPGQPVYGVNVGVYMPVDSWTLK